MGYSPAGAALALETLIVRAFLSWSTLAVCLALEALLVPRDDSPGTWFGDRYAAHYGERLRPAALLREMVGRGATFYKG